MCASTEKWPQKSELRKKRKIKVLNGCYIIWLDNSYIFWKKKIGKKFEKSNKLYACIKYKYLD